MAADDGAAPIPVARPSDLEAMPPDVWAVFLRHVRAALNDVDDDLLSTRLKQLRSTPAGKLAGGRLRAELCRSIAVSGPVWTAVAARVAADPALAATPWLHGAGPSVPPPERAQDPAPARDGAAMARQRDKQKQLRSERDAAVRRAEGLEARLRTNEQRARDLEQELAASRSRERELERRLAAEAVERDQAIERVRRQGEAEVGSLRDEARDLRRRLQEREVEEQRRRRAAADADERARSEIEQFRAAAPAGGARPGRPSTLPGGVAPGSPAAARALVTAGRLVLIDGYNVSKQARPQLDLEHQRAWLIREADAVATLTGCRPVLIFDGVGDVSAPAGGSKLVRVRYTSDETADDEIVRWVGRLGATEPVVVVTDDREIIERVGALHADVIGTRAFLTLTSRSR